MASPAAVERMPSVARRTVTRAAIAELVVDARVQRSLDQPRVDRLAAAFIPEALGVLTVSLKADGTKAIIDGQHRHAAALKVGYVGDVDVVQYEGLEPSEEAVLFLALNNTKTVSPLDKFKARVLAGEPDAVAIRDILAEGGWSVSTAQKQWTVSAISAVERVYSGSQAGTSVDGPALLRDVLKIVGDAWNGQSNSAHSTILLALGKFLAWNGRDVDFRRLSHELSQLKPMNFIADIRATKEMQRVDTLNAGARILVGVYNHRLRHGRLPEWQHR